MEAKEEVQGTRRKAQGGGFAEGRRGDAVIRRSGERGGGLRPVSSPLSVVRGEGLTLVVSGPWSVVRGEGQRA